jgi:IPT/TIG domain
MTIRYMIFAMLAAAAVSAMAAAGLAAPVIEAISPAKGPAGGKVTITGRGFMNDNSIVVGSAVIAHVGVAGAIAIACTADPKCKPGIRQSLDFSIPKKVPNGIYTVKVKNASGVSNAVTIAVGNVK